MSAPAKTYTPPSFGNFGKSAKDLFKKKYDYNNELKVVGPRTKLGLNVETGLVTDKKTNATRAYLKSSYNAPELGAFESEFHTDAAKESKTTLKLAKQPIKGLNAKFGYHTKNTPCVFKAGYASAEFDYTRNLFAASALVKSDLTVHRADASASFGFDGLSVGGKAELDLSSGAKLEALNFGAEYQQPDFTASVFTEKNRNNVVASFFQRLGADHVVGASLTADLKNNTRSLSLGNDYRLDVDTTLRAKADIASGNPNVTVSTALEHRLARPSVLLGVASEFKVVPSSGVETSNLGVNLTFGDF